MSTFFGFGILNTLFLTAILENALICDDLIPSEPLHKMFPNEKKSIY